MTIALIGHGKMGKEIERVSRERGIVVTRIFTSENNSGACAITREALSGTDVCIDFSTPSAVAGNIIAVARCGKNIVVGTTGWQKDFERVKRIVINKKVGLLHSTNFSIGINLFYQAIAAAARLFNRFEQYDVAVSESHHREKVDIPSGTSLTIGQIIMDNLRRKKSLIFDVRKTPIKPQEIHISSARVGSVTGRHTVIFDSVADSIELTHTAKDRSGFAIGALVAAEWLRGRKGIYTLKDMLAPV